VSQLKEEVAFPYQLPIPVAQPVHQTSFPTGDLRTSCPRSYPTSCANSTS